MSKQCKKWLTPTKKPSLSTKVLTSHDSNYSSLNATIQCARRQLSKSKQKPQKMVESILQKGSDLRQLSSTEHILDKKSSNKSSNLSLINNKIDSILSSSSKTKSQKEKQKSNSKERIKISKQNKQNKIIVAPTPHKLENQKDLFKSKSKNKVQIPTLTLKDININIYNSFNTKEIHNKKIGQGSKDYPVIPALFIPKPKKPSNQSLVKNKSNEDVNYKMNSFSLSLEELQNSEQQIDNLLTTLEKDFLPKNADFFIYNEEQIKVPKIFRKSKANSQMYKSFTEVDNKIKDSSIEVFKSVLIEKSTMRKGSMSQSLSLIERQLNNFLMGLKTQICLDSEFKKMKKWFLFSKIQDKWKKLEQQLRINNLWVNQLTMKVIFLYQNQEGTLFQSIYQQEYSIKQLVLTFRTAQQHWNDYILNKFDDKLIRGAGFTQNVLDSSKKGYISIEDLIRFLHCKLKQFYYTRDLNMIYLRLKGGQKLQYKEIMAKISSN